MGRILILDGDPARRAQLVDALRRAANADPVVVDSDAELISRVLYGIYSAVFADADLLNDNLPSLLEAVRSAIARPMLVIASNDRHRDLDGDLVTLIVRKPYDVGMVTGILISSVLGGVPGQRGATEDDPEIRT